MESSGFPSALQRALLIGQVTAAPLSRAEIEARVASAGADLSNLEAPWRRSFRDRLHVALIFSALVSEGANLHQGRNCAAVTSIVAILRDATLINADLAESSLYSSVLANVRYHRRRSALVARLMGSMDRAVLEGADPLRYQGGSDMGNQPMGLVRSHSHACPAQGCEAESCRPLAR